MKLLLNSVTTPLNTKTPPEHKGWQGEQRYPDPEYRVGL